MGFVVEAGNNPDEAFCSFLRGKSIHLLIHEIHDVAEPGSLIDHIPDLFYRVFCINFVQVKIILPEKGKELMQKEMELYPEAAKFIAPLIERLCK